MLFYYFRRFYIMDNNYGFVKCAIATFNSNLSNPIDATESIKHLVEKADDEFVKVLVFPELCMTGYTCQDLFEFPQLLNQTLECLKDLVTFSRSYDTLFVVGAPLRVLDSLYNCAVVIHRGEICGVVPKQFLPNYGEFYEKRWFTPYTDTSIQTIDFFIYYLLRKHFSRKKIIFLATVAFEQKYSLSQLEKYYDDFIGRFFRNQFKRNCLPDGPKVGTVSVSPRGDLRLPSDTDGSNW